MISFSNKSLSLIAIISVLASTLITLLLIFNPFEDYDPLYVSGKTLYIKSYEPLIVKDYRYLDLDNSQKILNAPEGKSLAILNIEITNAASSEIRMISNESSSEFISKDGFTYMPVNPYSISTDTDINGEDLSYPIWGSFTLNNMERAEGFLLFIVKDTFKPDKFAWIASDRVLITFD
ncbi:MAG: hypothetical protein VX590_01545 [Chloroflexota bacterium]|nr:hypothetical protein [Chloroflexota bacterium]|tara:strand:- start:237 stop:770 length:534 start_codon:yes stop_codon:yes gene_type:complete